MKKKKKLSGFRTLFGSTAQTLLPYVIIVCLGIYAMWSLTIPGIYKAHDTEAHISRLIAFQEGLHDGQFPPRWAGYFFGELGSPVLSLNYTLPYFMATSIHSVGFSLFDSYKLTLALSYIASGIAAYLAFKTLFGRVPGFLGAILYMWAPYRFLDIFVRSAFGESVSFVFPPLILLAFHKRWWWLLVLSFAGLFLTHPVVSALFCLFFFPYCTIFLYQQKQLSQLRYFLVSFLLALGIAAFNIVPSLFETHFTHYAPSNSEPLRHFPSMMQLIRSPWGYGYSETNQHDWLSFQLGVAQWIILVSSTGLLFRRVLQKKVVKEALLPLLAVFVCWTAIFLMIPQSLFLWNVFHIAAIIDFPWRITFLVVFLVGYLGAWLLSQLPRTVQYLALVALLFLAVYGNRNHLSIIETLPYTQHYFRVSNQTGDDWGEYAAIYRKTRGSTRLPQRVEVLKGAAKISLQESKSQRVKVLITAKTESVVRFNIMYFPGWIVLRDGKQLTIGKECQITKTETSQQDTSGLIQCVIPKGVSHIDVEFTDTSLRRVSNLITCVSLLVFLWYLFLLLFQHITKQKISSLF